LGPVVEFQYLNTCNTPFNDRSTTGYKIEVSEDNVNWEVGATGSLAACADIQGDPKVIQNTGPQEGIKYVKFSTTQFYKNGGGMNYFAACGPPTPAPPTPPPTTPAPTACGVSHPVSPYATCSAWGDPHYTASFTKGKFDFMGFGVYRMGRSVDGCFEVQAYQCQVGSSSPSTYAGFAIKAGTHVVQIVDSQVYVDGEEVSSDSYPADISMQGSPLGKNFEMSLCDCGNTSGSVGYFFAKFNPGASYGINGYLDMSFEMNEAVVALDGVCANDAASAQIKCNGNGKLNSLFTTSQISTLNAACGLEDCPPPPLPPKTPEESCEEAGIDHSTAAAKCNEKGAAADQVENCILDYCASGGSDDFPEPPKTPAPPFTSMPTPPPTPPTPAPPTLAPPTPAPALTPNVPKCTNCGPRPKECWKACGQTKGYCSACDSAGGVRGACCYAGDPSEPAPPATEKDPEECDAVDPAQFLYTGYHVCVLVP